MKEQSESCRRRSGAGLRGAVSSAGRRRHAIPLSPLTTVIVASVLTIMLLMGLGWQVRQSYMDHKDTQKQVFPIGRLRGRIIHFDEVLTMSANMAAATGEAQWEKRYRQVEPQLDVAIKSLKKLVPKTFDIAAATQIDEANIKLVEMENQIFELVGQGRLDEAQAILSGDDYRGQKKLYSDGMERIAADLENYITADLESNRKRSLVAIVSVLLGLPLLALIWLWVLQNMQRHLKERDQAERALRESEERFRSLVGNIPGVVYRCRAMYPWPVEHVSEVIFEISGYHAEDLLEGRIQGIGALIVAEDVEDAKRLVAAGVAGHRPFELKYRIRHADGVIRWVHETGRPVYDGGDEALWLDGIILDITEGKLVEEALKKSEARYRSLTDDVLDSSELGLFILDADFKVAWINQAIERFFGLQRDQVIGKDKRDLIRAQISEIFESPQEFIDKVISTYDNNTYVERFECHVFADGTREERWLEHRSLPIRSGLYAGGRMEHYIDITQRKRAEERLTDSEKRSRAWLENSPVCTKILDLDFNLQYMSRAGIDGLKIDDITEFYGKPFPLYFYPESTRHSMTKCLEKVMETGGIVTGETPLFDLEGNEVWYYATFVPVKNDEGQIEYIIIVSVDTTKRKRAEEQIANLARFPSENPSPVLRIARDGTLLYANDASESILEEWGCREGQPVPDEWCGIISGVFETREERKVEIEHAGRVLSFMIVPVIEAGYANLYCRDTTERKRAEAQVANLARFPSENPNPVLRITRDGILLYANDTSGSILREWDCREGDAVPDEWRGIISGVFETGEETKIEREHAGRVLSFMIIPVIEAGYANLYCRDTTKRKRAEDALKLRFDLEELLTSISTEFISLEPDEIDDGIERALESIIDAACVDRGYIFLYSIDGATMDNTHEHCRQGVPPHKGRLQDVPVEKFPWFDARIKRFETVAIDSVATLTEEAEAGKGEWLYEGILSLLCVPMVFQGRLMGFVGFDTVLYENQWREEIITFVKILGTVFANALERKRSGQERERLLKTLAVKNEELQSIVYVASHDLKSPLVNIEGFSGELSRTCEQIDELLHCEEVPADIQKALAPLLDEDIPESIGFIRAGTLKMQALLNGLMAVCRVGSAALQIEALEMDQMMKRIIASMQYQITSSGADVIVDDLPACIGDSDHVNQVFSNLLTNAVKYLDPSRKGDIHISGRAEAGESIYCVQDNGLGIAPQHQERVFEIFHRLNPDRHAEGEGLGLTIALRILERHEGRIWVESEPGKGSKFFVLLPTA